MELVLSESFQKKLGAAWVLYGSLCVAASSLGIALYAGGIFISFASGVGIAAGVALMILGAYIVNHASKRGETPLENRSIEHLDSLTLQKPEVEISKKSYSSPWKTRFTFGSFATLGVWLAINYMKGGVEKKAIDDFDQGTCTYTPEEGSADLLKTAKESAVSGLRGLAFFVFGFVVHKKLFLRSLKAAPLPGVRRLVYNPNARPFDTDPFSSY